jgi:hypothetical protein
MSANEILASLYDPGARQLVGVDGEFWRHEIGGDWEWMCKFGPHPGDFRVYSAMIAFCCVALTFVILLIVGIATIEPPLPPGF